MPVSKISVSGFSIRTFSFELAVCCLCCLFCRCLVVIGLGSWSAYWSCSWVWPLLSVITSFVIWICAFIPWAFVARPIVPSTFCFPIASWWWAVFLEIFSSWAVVTAFVFSFCAKSCSPSWRPLSRLIRGVWPMFWDGFWESFWCQIADWARFALFITTFTAISFSRTDLVEFTMVKATSWGWWAMNVKDWLIGHCESFCFLEFRCSDCFRYWTQ